MSRTVRRLVVTRVWHSVRALTESIPISDNAHGAKQSRVAFDGFAPTDKARVTGEKLIESFAISSSITRVGHGSHASTSIGAISDSAHH